MTLVGKYQRSEIERVTAVLGDPAGFNRDNLGYTFDKLFWRDRRDTEPKTRRFEPGSIAIRSE
jgi:hypothetical protein